MEVLSTYQRRSQERGVNTARSRAGQQLSILDFLEMHPLAVVPKPAPTPMTWAAQAKHDYRYRLSIRPCSLEGLGKQAAIAKALTFIEQFGVTL